MKKIFLTLIPILLLSCQKDNYMAPDAAIYGSFIDIDTGELVPQDIYNGTEIEYIEKGYTTIEKMVVKNDGTYRNALIFSGEYEITPKRGNFEPLEPQTVKIEGETKLDFHVRPYIRINDLVIYRNGDKIVAQFNLEQTGYDNVSNVALFAYSEPSVGYLMFDASQVVPVGERFAEEKMFTIVMDIPSSNLEPGNTYFFRAGALINVPEAKYNYGPTIRLDI